MRVLWGAMALLVAGCSLGDAVLPRDEGPGPEPSYRKIVAVGVPGILGSPERARGLQISGPRHLYSLKGPAWLVCLRTGAEVRPLDYAIFIRDDKIVESRLAVRADRCDEQAFNPFGMPSQSQTAIH